VPAVEHLVDHPRVLAMQRVRITSSAIFAHEGVAGSRGSARTAAL
jgi:hypothetical protein